MEGGSAACVISLRAELRSVKNPYLPLRLWPSAGAAQSYILTSISLLMWKGLIAAAALQYLRCVCACVYVCV